MTVPTQNDRAELAVLSACMIRPSILGWVDVSDHDFVGPRHQQIWDSMRTLFVAGVAVDPVTLEAELVKRGILDQIGGLKKLTQIAQAVGTADNVEHYAELVRDARVGRETVLAAGAAIERAKSADMTGPELLDETIAELGKVDRWDPDDESSLGAAMVPLMHEIRDGAARAAAGETAVRGMPTGIQSLDRHTGGLPLGKPGVLGARPGEGKSTLLRIIATHVAENHGPAVVFSNEDRRSVWGERALADATGIPLDRIAQCRLDAHELGAIINATGDLRDRLRNLHIVHVHGWSAIRICRRAATLELRYGELRFMGVDYIQRVVPPARGLKMHDAIEQNSGTFSDFVGSRPLLALLLLSQLTKECEKEERRPRLSDLRYGEGLAMHCKFAMLLHDPKKAGGELPSDSKNAHEILIPKNNQGPNNTAITIDYDREHNRMS